MSIKIQCRSCGHKSSLNDRLAGRTIRCPQCEAEVQIPTAEQIAAAKLKKEKAAQRQTDPWNNIAPAPLAIPLALPTAKKRPQEEEAVFEPLPIGKKERVETEMDMTPMVDVTFLLLIFFMVTASFSLQKSLEMPKQQSDAPSSQPQEEPPEELDQITVQVNEFGGFMVLATDWEREVAGKPTLVGALREAKQPLGNKVRLTIECHEAAQLQALVDVLDAGAVCEYSELQITTVDGF